MKYWILIFLFLISSKSFSQDSTLFNRVIDQLNLDRSKIKNDLMVAKVWPHNTKETIMVIPEIVKEDEDYFVLNSYLLIVNNETGKIINKYFEPSAWQSDAIILSEIKIDTTAYILSENKRAFGIRLRYHTLSQPNPYGSSTLSLYVKSGYTLKEILRTYEVVNYSAEWNMRCDGESVGHERTLRMATKKTNDHYDILVENEITFTESFEDENGDCNATEEITTQKTVLKFNGEEYTEGGTFRPLDVYLNDPDENATNIRREPNGKIIQKLNDQDDYFTLTITEASNGWFKLIKVIDVEGNNIEISGGTGWIHNSVLEVSTRKKVELLEAPQYGSIVGIIDQEIQVKIKDRYLDWVQIEYKGLIGWIKSEWICGNPVTTCP